MVGDIFGLRVEFDVAGCIVNGLGEIGKGLLLGLGLGSH